MTCITKTYIAKTDKNERNDFDAFKLSCQKIGTVTNSKFKNSFILRIPGHECTILCFKNGSFTIMGVKKEEFVINCLTSIFGKKDGFQLSIYPVLANYRVVFKPIPSLESLRLYINNINGTGFDSDSDKNNRHPSSFFAYKAPKHTGLTIRIKADTSQVPITVINGSEKRITLGVEKKKQPYVTILLFKSGIAIFSGIHEVCIFSAISGLTDLLKTFRLQYK